MGFLKAKFKKRPYIVIFIGRMLLILSRWQHSSFLPLKLMGSLTLAPLHFIMRDNFYKFLIYIQRDNGGTKFTKLPRFMPNPIFLGAITGNKSVTTSIFSQYLESCHYDPDVQREWSRRFMEVGRLDLAEVGFADVLKRKQDKLSMDNQLNTHRLLGAVCFMLGKNAEALVHWKNGGLLRRSMFKPTTPKNYRILGPSWFVAIGHVAMLDYYMKFRKLYPIENLRIVVSWDMDKIPGVDLMYKFAELGLNILKPDQLESDYDNWAVVNNAPLWEQLSDNERAAMVDDFWEYDFPDGDILGYAHAAARIQQEWEQAGYAPLIQLNNAEKQWVTDYLANLGMPRDAWYVCLHVREPGFHKQWNTIYPSMRDASINDYQLAIEKIVEAGGWVLRMGDSSMKPLPEMKNVIDYSQSEYKTGVADILLAASCRFFVGTNSGYATIPAIYNVPCLLTNWIPIGWPLWPSQDLLLPKLFKEKRTGTYLSIQQIFDRGLAFIQNWSDLPEDLELVSNTPVELSNAIDEMLVYCGILCTNLEVGATKLIQERYKRIANAYHAFTGSQFSRTFTMNHPDVFSGNLLQPNMNNKGGEITWHEQLNNNTMATSN